MDGLLQLYVFAHDNVCNRVAVRVVGGFLSKVGNLRFNSGEKGIELNEGRELLM